MSDLPQDNQEQQDPSTATMHPALQAFQDAIPDSAAEAPWAQEVTTRLNDWVQKRDMADANEAAANQYTANIGDFKSGLVNMVTADPTAHQVALDIVDPTLHQLMPYDWMDPSKHDETHSALSDDIKYQIAHASVAEMARRDGDAARSLMDSPAIAEHLDDQDKAGLSGYIQAHEVARGVDGASQQREASIQAQRVATATMHGYAASMVNPDTGQVTFPTGWAQKLTDDPNVSPTDRGALMHLAGRLHAIGDNTTEAQTLAGMIEQVNGMGQHVGERPSSSDIFGRVANGQPNDLSMKDAVWLNGLSNTESVEGQMQRQQLADTVRQARYAVMGKDGEYGAAGASAFQRFMDWFVPAYQKAGPESLDPTNDKYLFSGTNVAAFKPTNEDLVLSSMRGRYGSAPAWPKDLVNDRISLQDIFSGRRPPSSGMDQVKITDRNAALPPIGIPKVGDDDKDNANMARTGDPVIYPEDK